MYHVYLLRSIQSPHMTYVGFSQRADIRKRMQEHNTGLSKTTRPHIPWKIEVLISFASKQKAEAFEYYLKKGSGYAFSKKHFWTE